MSKDTERKRGREDACKGREEGSWRENIRGRKKKRKRKKGGRKNNTRGVNILRGCADADKGIHHIKIVGTNDNNKRYITPNRKWAERRRKIPKREKEKERKKRRRKKKAEINNNK